MLLYLRKINQDHLINHVKDDLIQVFSHQFIVLLKTQSIGRKLVNISFELLNKILNFNWLVNWLTRNNIKLKTFQQTGSLKKNKHNFQNVVYESLLEEKSLRIQCIFQTMGEFPNFSVKSLQMSTKLQKIL